MVAVVPIGSARPVDKDQAAIAIRRLRNSAIPDDRHRKQSETKNAIEFDPRVCDSRDSGAIRPRVGVMEASRTRFSF